MFSSTGTVLKECFQNFKQMLIMSWYDFRFQYNQTKLKLLWAVLDPATQCGVFYLVFYVGMGVRSPREDIGFLPWLLTGLIPWIFISGVLMAGSYSILSSAAIILNMRYPLAIIPIGAVLTRMMSHIASLFVLAGVHYLCGVRYTLALCWLLYFFLCENLFLIGYTFFFSTITVFFRDVPRIVSVLVRLLYFLTPIFWTPANEQAQWVTAWNPFSFLIAGYRGAMLYQGEFDIMPWQHIYFWSLTLFLLTAGNALHVKLRPYFSDYL